MKARNIVLTVDVDQPACHKCTGDSRAKTAAPNTYNPEITVLFAARDSNQRAHRHAQNYRPIAPISGAAGLVRPRSSKRKRHTRVCEGVALYRPMNRKALGMPAKTYPQEPKGK